MQLLYGNDGTNYRTISKSEEITSEQEKQLLGGYLGYEDVSDKKKYSSGYEEPVAISYVTTDLNSTLPVEMILLSKNARMVNFKAQSAYAHFILIEKTEEIYNEGFFRLLQYSFVKDTELNNYLSKSIDTFEPEKESGMYLDEKNALAKEKIFPIVASILDVVDSSSRQVNLILDVEGDGYNQRAMDVIASVYKYLPCSIRRKAGFSTYAGTNLSGSGRIKLQLYTRDALNKIKDNVIDLRNINKEDILCKISGDIIELTRKIIEGNDSEREELFHLFREVFGINPVTVQELIDFSRNKEKWESGTLEEIKDELAKYAYDEIQKGKSPAFTFFQNVVSARVKKEHFEDRYQEMLGEMLARQKDFAFDVKLKSYIMLGEALNSLQFDRRTFLKWEQEVILGPRYNQDVQLYKYLQDQLQMLQRTQIGGEKYKEIAIEMDEILKNKVSEIKGKIKDDEKEKGEKVREQCRKVIWKGKSDIFATFRIVTITQMVYRDYDVRGMKCILKINNNSYNLKLGEMGDLTESLLWLNSENQERLREIIHKRRGIIKDLLAIKALREEHFRFVISASEEEEQKEILEYYLKKDILLSEESVREGIGQVNIRMFLDEPVNNIQHNIVGMTLKKMKEEIVLEECGEEIDDHQNRKPADEPFGIFLGTMIPAIMFLISAIYKRKTSNGVELPVRLTVIAVFIVIMSLIIRFGNKKYGNEKCGGAMLGVGISIVTTWLAWLIF